jgi:uncharacterized protein
MSIYVVQLFYSADDEQLAAVRPDHRKFLADLGSKGILLASGPMVDYSGAHQIFEAESPEVLAALLDQDPFDIAGFIGERTINEWNPILGKWVLG